MAQTVQEATYGLLRQLGLTTIFGNPGSTEEPFLQKFPDDFTYVLALQEASVMAMADGFAQGTGRPALVNLHTIAGVGHSMGNLICAYYNKTPLVVTAGQQNREMLLLEPYLTNVRAIETPLPWVKWSYEPVKPTDVPAAMMRAFAAASQPPAGPAFLSIPLDDWDKEASGTPVVRTLSQRVGPDPDRLGEIAERIGRAKSPVFLVGAGIDRSDAWEAAVRFAEKLKIPVWAPPETDRAAFPEDHPLFQGFLPFAIKPLADKLKDHDLIVVVGAPVFRYYPYVPGDYLPQGAELIQITDDPEEAARAPIGDSLLSDSRLALELLVDRVTPGSYPAVAKRVFNRHLPDKPKDQPTPAEVFRTVQECRPADDVILIESTSNISEFHEWVTITKPRSFTLFASGGLGWALPAAVGFALAERETGRNRPVLCVLGDGAANYSIQALYTAARHKLPMIFLVLNNREYGILKAFADQQGTPGVPGFELPDIDFPALAKGYGCAAAQPTTTDALAEALREAYSRSGPTVIEIPIDRAVAPLLPDTSKA